MKPQFLIAAAALAFASVASAQPPGSGAVRQACAADALKFCAGKDGPDRRACMMSHQADLSAGCKAAIAQMRAQHGQPGGGAAH